MPFVIGTRDPYGPVPPGTIRGPGTTLTTPGMLGETFQSQLAGIGAATGRLGRGGMTDDELLEWMMQFTGGGDGGGYGGYGGGYGGGVDESALVRLQSELDILELQKQQAFEAGQTDLARQFEAQQAALMREFQTGERIGGQEFQAGEAEKQREFERQRALEELKAERQRIFAEMRGKDPVRAALFAMGVGGEILPGGERFVDLPPLAGAAEYGRQAATGLSKLTGGQVGVGARGVTGLPEIYKAAGAYSAGQRPGGAGRVGDIEAARTLLLSGYGVGGLGPEKQILGGPGAVGGMRGRPGISPEEALRKIQSVTPTGAAFR